MISLSRDGKVEGFGNASVVKSAANVVVVPGVSNLFANTVFAC